MAKYIRPVSNNDSKVAAYPIKDKKYITLMMNYLLKKIELANTDVKKKQARRNWMLVLLGFNTAFRVEDLIQLRVKDVERGFFTIREKKTGKVQNYRINKLLYEDINFYIKEQELSMNDYLFSSQKNKWLTPITRQQVDDILKVIAREIRLPQRFSAHSMRKTWAYQQHIDGTPLLTISRMLNHYDVEETLIYICWGDEDVQKTRTMSYYGGAHRK